MQTTIAERFRLQHRELSLEVEDLLQECEVFETDPVVGRNWTVTELEFQAPRDPEHWKLFLDQACNRRVDLDGVFVDRSAWLYEDCYLDDERTRLGYWWQDRERIPARDVRFND